MSVSIEEFIDNRKRIYGEAELFRAVEELKNNEIVFEGQFTFLTSEVFKDKFLYAIRELFFEYGYERPEDILNHRIMAGYNGCMGCLMVYGNILNGYKEIEKAVIRHFSNKSTF